MIKPITESDLNDCLDLLKASYEAGAIRFGQTEENCPHRGRTRLPLSKFRQEFLDGHQMYGYYHDDKRVGFLALSFNDGVVRVCDLAILPEYQNRGFGSDFMQFIHDEAIRLDCKIIRLGMIDDNTELKAWYKKHGYKTINLTKFDTVTYTVGLMELVL